MSAEIKLDPKQCKGVLDLASLGKLSDVLPCLGAMIGNKPAVDPKKGQEATSNPEDPAKNAAKALKGFAIDLPNVMKQAAGEEKK